jgi:tetratricopeptide (TPR) repeat protein
VSDTASKTAALELIAQGAGQQACDAAFQLHTKRAQQANDEATAESACWLLVAASTWPSALPEAIDAVGGQDKAVLCLQGALQRTRSQALGAATESRQRAALAAVLERGGDLEPAYAQSTKAFRAQPEMAERVDLLLRLAMAAHKSGPAASLMRGAIDASADNDVRARLWRAVASLAEHDGEWAEACAAAEASLGFVESKGLRRKLEQWRAQQPQQEPPQEPQEEPQQEPPQDPSGITDTVANQAVTAHMIDLVKDLRSELKDNGIPSAEGSGWAVDMDVSSSGNAVGEPAANVSHDGGDDNATDVAGPAAVEPAQEANDPSLFGDTLHSPGAMMTDEMEQGPPATERSQRSEPEPEPEPEHEQPPLSAHNPFAFFREPLHEPPELREAAPNEDSQAFAPPPHLLRMPAPTFAQAMAAPAAPEPAPPPSPPPLPPAPAPEPEHIEDAAWCRTRAKAKFEANPSDPSVLPHAIRALMLDIDDPNAPYDEAIDICVDAIACAPMAKMTAVRDMHARIPTDQHTAFREVWLAAARKDPRNVDLVVTLLSSCAVLDAPHGPCFVQLCKSCEENAAWSRLDHCIEDMLAHPMWQGPATHQDRRVLVKQRVRAIEQQGRVLDALQLQASEVLRPPIDVDELDAARRGMRSYESLEQRLRFLSLAARAAGEQKLVAVEVDLLRELLRLRVGTSDGLGIRSCAERLLQLVPDDAEAVDAWLGLGKLDPQLWPECRRLLRQAHPHDGAVFRHLSFAMELAADDRLFAELVWQAVTIKPSVVAGQRDLAVRVLEACAVNHVNMLEALAQSVAGVFVNDDATHLWMLGAQLAEAHQRVAVARSLAASAVEASPQHLGARDALVRLLRHIGDVRQAVEVLRGTIDLVSAKETRAALLRELSQMLEAQGEHVPAQQALVDAMALRPDDASGWAHLRRLSDLAGDGDVAAQALAGEANALEGSQRTDRQLELARLHFHDQPGRSGTALEDVLRADAGNADALMLLTSLQVRRWHGTDIIGACLDAPHPDLLSALRPSLQRARASGAALTAPQLHLLACAWETSQPQDAYACVVDALELDGSLRSAKVLRCRLWDHRTDAGGAAHVALLEELFGESALPVDAKVRVATALCTHTQVGAPARALQAATAVLSMVRSEPSLATLLTPHHRQVMVDVIEAATGLAASAREPLLLEAIALDLATARAPAEKSRLWVRRAKLLWGSSGEGARTTLEEALRVDPTCSEARELLLDLQLANHDPVRSIDDMRQLVEHETNDERRAQLLIRLFRLLKKREPTSKGLDDLLRRAMTASPRDALVADVAARHYSDTGDWPGLVGLLTHRLRCLQRSDVTLRVQVLEELGAVRRWQLRDHAGAIDAWSGVLALQPVHPRAHVELAHLYDSHAQHREAAEHWRQLLERDPFDAEAWHGLPRSLAHDEAVEELVQATQVMTALGVASDDVVRTVRAGRSPFPQWPRHDGGESALRRLAHAGWRTPTGAVLETLAHHLAPRLGRSLDKIRSAPSEVVPADAAPSSMAMALRACATLLPTSAPFALVPTAANEAPPVDGVVALPTPTPTLLIDRQWLRGGMTPARAFALGRAAVWAQPLSLMVSLLTPTELKQSCEGWVGLLLMQQDMETHSDDARAVAEHQRSLLSSLQNPAAHEQTMATMTILLRNYVHGRAQSNVRSLIEAVEHTANRAGLLLAADFDVAMHSIPLQASAHVPARTALHDLLLFALSPAYAQLREDLHVGSGSAAGAALRELWL